MKIRRLIPVCSWICRRKCRLCLSSCFFFLLVLVLYITHLAQKHKCSHQQSTDYVQRLCDDFQHGRVAGSLCRDLCHKQHIRYDTCVNYHSGKTVMFMTCDKCGDKAVRVVLKDNEKEERVEGELDILKNGIMKVDEIVLNTILMQTGLNMSSHSDILSYVWGVDYNKYIRTHSNVPDIKAVVSQSILKLVAQQEYLLMRVLQQYSFAPKIYGTCGSAYFLEFTKSLEERTYSIFKETFSWSDQVKVAISLIDMLQVLDQDTNLPQQLHLCDVKLDNFGLRANGQVTLIDIDCAFYDKNLMSQFEHSNCTSDEDCHFFDCKGSCDKNNGTCLLQRTNNNLQSLCEKVFISKLGMIRMGLLRDPPRHSRKEVETALNQCAYPGQPDRQDPKWGHASLETRKKLVKVLKDSVKH